MWEDFKDELKKDFWETIAIHFIIFIVFGIVSIVIVLILWFLWKPILIILFFVLIISAIGCGIFVALIKIIDKWEDYKDRGEK